MSLLSGAISTKSQVCFTHSLQINLRQSLCSFILFSIFHHHWSQTINDIRFGDVYYHIKWLKSATMEKHIKLLVLWELKLTFCKKYFSYNHLGTPMFALHFGEPSDKKMLFFWVKFNYKGCAGTRGSLKDSQNTLAFYNTSIWVPNICYGTNSTADQSSQCFYMKFRIIFHINKAFGYYYLHVL